MRRVALCVLATASLCAQTRYARLGDIAGSVEVEIHPSEPWKPALRNMALLEASSIRTGGASHAEVELDEGSVLRLAENSTCELSDYTRLSTGQRITHISLDRGVGYFDGESGWRDALVLALPGAKISVRRGSRVRLEAGLNVSQLAVLEGAAWFASSAIEIDVPEGKMLSLDPARPDKFHLSPEISQLDSDIWSLTRDKLLAGDSSRNRLPGLRYGVRDLDENGEWIDTSEFGLAWKPKMGEGWAPFREGKWQWYDGLGFTWISAESWGWLPYHYGRWMLAPSQGWIWAPGSRVAFKPGDVYWLRGPNLAGWGPLAPGETWRGSGTPSLYLKASTTFAKYAPSPDLREIDPAGFTAPQDPLAAAGFVESLPAARVRMERIEYARDQDRPGVIRLAAGPAPGERWHAPEPVTQAPAPAQPQRAALPPPPPVIALQPAAAPAPAADPEPAVETVYLAPVYTGIIVMNPPEKKPDQRQKKKSASGDPPHSGN